jgi:2-oxoglutarate dehydrogenase E2 component (dihydrolipoamide succinyltransferase)
MSIELRVPEVGESINEVQIGDWLKKVGDIVERDEPVVVIETDKVTVELLAPERGRLAQVILEKGVAAKVHDLVGRLEEATVAASVAPTKNSVSTTGAGPSMSSSVLPPSLMPLPSDPQIAVAREPAPAAPQQVVEERAALTTDVGNWASPSARRARAEQQARGADTSPARVIPPAAVKPAPVASNVPATTPSAASTGHREEEVIAMSPFRRTIAERLVHAKNEAALLTTFNEVDLSTVQELRHRYQETFQQRHQVKLGMMSFFIKAAVEALKQIPVLNAEVRGTDVVYKNYYDIGVAVGGGRGLVVPVLRSVEYLGLAEIERAIVDFAMRAKGNKLQLTELVGGTFTISNGGVYGSMLSTPIVNSPQSGILGLHSIQDRPIALQGQVVIRPMMYIALTYDHRIVDGREAVTFLRLIKEFVEQPARILLEV